MVYELVGMWWMTGTVYLNLDPEAVSAETTPLEYFRLADFFTRDQCFRAVRWDMKRKKREGGWRWKRENKMHDSQRLQCGLNVRKFEEDGPVRDTLIVKHEADAPDNGREADILGAGQVVQNNLGLDLGGHVVLRSDNNSIKG
jgi:hypothetical protein